MFYYFFLLTHDIIETLLKLTINFQSKKVCVFGVLNLIAVMVLLIWCSSTNSMGECKTISVTDIISNIVVCKIFRVEFHSFSI